MPYGVSKMMNNYTLMNEYPDTHMAMITVKSGIVMFQGPFFTYLVRSCIRFLTQLIGQTMLRKCEIKIPLLNIISILCYIKLLFL